MVVNGAISDRNIFRHSVFVQVKCLQATNTKKYLLLKPHRLPYHVYMLKIGSEVIIDKSSQYPEPWAQEPYDLMWGDTNIGIMTLDELGALKTAVTKHTIVKQLPVNQWIQKAVGGSGKTTSR